MADVERCENIMYEFSLYFSFKVSYFGIQSMKKKSVLNILRIWTVLTN